MSRFIEVFQDLGSSSDLLRSQARIDSTWTQYLSIRHPCDERTCLHTVRWCHTADNGAYA